MYSDISNVFLNNIRAIKYYVESVDPTMDNYQAKTSSDNNDAFSAAMVYTVIKAKKEGYNVSEKLQNIEGISKNVVNYFKDLESYVQEAESDGNRIRNYLPKNVRKEYQNFEVREKQKEILYRGSLLLLVTYFENLVAGILRECFAKYPQRISLDEKSVSYKMLTEVNNIEEIKDILIDQEVTSKMYESLLDWKNYFQKNIKLNLKAWDEQFEVIQEIVARRNLYVHNNGIINSIYINLVKKMDKNSLGEDLTIDRNYIDDAIERVEYIGMALVIEAWIKECADKQEEVRDITDLIFEEYLEPQRWDMARRFYEICLQSSKILISDEILCKINSWQCYKWLGEYDKIKNEVEMLDVSAYLPRYTLGILVLKEQYEEFFKFYDNQTDIGEEELKEWPLFMELRKSKEYLERFPEGKLEEKEQIECKDTKDVTDD